ncbi:MAG: DNA-binding protein [Gemmatimonadota bacterium]|nr:MAG: DNA-binding protein [Gemmatimonadota bacterium]
MRYVRHGDTYVIRFEDDEVVPDRLLELLAAESVTAGSLTGIGALRSVRIAYFDTDRREYLDMQVDEQLEVLALVGNVAVYQDQPLVHAHVTLGRRDGTTLGGHLRWGIVRPTLEVYLRVIPGRVERAIDPEYGLPSLDLKDRR